MSAPSPSPCQPERLCPKADVGFCAPDKTGKTSLVFGKKMAALCLAVQECGSLHTAAKMAGMSYSQAWKKVGFAEEALGESLFIRRGNKGSVLSPAGEQLLELYLSLNESVAEKADTLFYALENNIILE